MCWILSAPSKESHLPSLSHALTAHKTHRFYLSLARFTWKIVIDSVPEIEPELTCVIALRVGDRSGQQGTAR